MEFFIEVLTKDLHKDGDDGLEGNQWLSGNQLTLFHLVSTFYNYQHHRPLARQDSVARLAPHNVASLMILSIHTQTKSTLFAPQMFLGVILKVCA